MIKSELSGKRIKLIRMEDPYTNLKSGDEGTIIGEDDMNHIMVKWDNGSNLNLIKNIDEYEVKNEKKSDESSGFNGRSREEIIQTLSDCSDFEKDDMNSMSMDELKELWDSLEIDDWLDELKNECYQMKHLKKFGNF